MKKTLMLALVLSLPATSLILPASAGASWYWRPEYAQSLQPKPVSPAPSEPVAPSQPTPTQTTYPSWYTYDRSQLLQPSTGGQTPAPTPTQPAPAPTQPAPAPVPQPGVTVTADEARMLELINRERQNVALKPLQMDLTLVRLARMKSQDILDKNYFAHTSPTYGSPFKMMKDAGVTYKIAGENLSKAKDMPTSHVRLMASEAHRANILNPGFTHVGIGIVYYQYGVVVTQLYIGK